MLLTLGPKKKKINNISAEQERHGLTAVFELTEGSIHPKCNASVKKAKQPHLVLSEDTLPEA